jgi:hypothetical protein
MDDILVFAFTTALVVAIRTIVRHRSPDNPEKPTNE